MMHIIYIEEPHISEYTSDNKGDSDSSVLPFKEA